MSEVVHVGLLVLTGLGLLAAITSGILRVALDGGTGGQLRRIAYLPSKPWLFSQLFLLLLLLTAMYQCGGYSGGYSSGAPGSSGSSSPVGRR